MEIEIDNMHNVNELCRITCAISAVNQLIFHKLMIKE